MESDSWIIDFWIIWRQLSYLWVVNNNDSSISTRVKCNKWLKKSKAKNYNKEIFGIKIKQLEDNETIIESTGTKESLFKTMKWKEEIKRELMWQVWNDFIDADTNLQCNYWCKTFWFDCLTGWMLEKNVWPNWESILNKSNIQKNRDFEMFVNILKIEAEKQKEPLWGKHQVEWKLFWKEWNLWICHKWMIKNMHKDHKIVEIGEAVEVLYKNTVSELNDKKSYLNESENAIKKLEYNYQLIKTIFNVAVDPVKKSINELWEQYNSENIKLLTDYKEKLNSSFSEWEMNEILFKQYYDTENILVINEVSKALIKEERLIETVNELTEDVSKKISKNKEFISFNKPLEFNVSYPLSTLSDNESFWLQIKGKSNKKLIVIIEPIDNILDVSIQSSKKLITDCYCKIELRNNERFEVENDQIVKVNRGEISARIDRIIMKSGWENNLDLDFKILIWEKDKNINDHINSFKRSIMSKAIKDHCGENLKIIEGDINENNHELENETNKQNYEKEFEISNENDKSEMPTKRKYQRKQRTEKKTDSINKIKRRRNIKLSNNDDEKTIKSKGKSRSKSKKMK